MGDLSDSDLADLRLAKSLLENPGLAARLADIVGRPIEAGFKVLPKDWRVKVAEATHHALMKGLVFAVRTMPYDAPAVSRNGFHKLAVTLSGAGGGAFGLAALAVELPLSTTIILRSIADIARTEGHDLRRMDVRLSCLEVLALGSPSGKDDATQSGYWTVRTVLARTVSEAAAYLAERGAAEEGAPPLVRLITAVASRFGVVVSEEVAAKAIPIVGAIGGGTINYLFIDHFQRMARGHFIVKRLEGRYGLEAVRQAYGEMVE